jgi:PAS domain S-box-containing protein
MVTAASQYSVLVVEDNPDLVIGLQDLVHHDGYAVTVAGTVADADAIALVRSHRFNTIILDLGLPDGDGLEVLKETQRLDPSLPVVIVTAHISQDRTVGSLMEGAFAYLTKPYHQEELRQTLRRAIGVKELAVKVERVQHLLSESEDRFRSLVESATDAIIVANGHGLILSWNRSASKLFGYADEEVIGQPLTLLMPARYRHAHEQGLARMDATGKGRVMGSVIELHGLKKDGTEFPIELSLATWKNTENTYYSGIIRDISERKKAEQSLAQLQRQHSLILTQAGEGIYGLDGDGLTTFVNPTAARLLGYDPDELAGRPMHQILHHSRPDGSPYPVEQCPIYAALRDGLVHRVSTDVLWRKDQTSLPVEYISTPIVEQGAVTGAVVVFRDITERREAERAVQEGQERLRQLAEHIRGVFGMTDPAKQDMLYISPGYEEIWGRSCESLYASPQSWLEAIHPEDRARVLEAATHKQAVGTYDEQYRILRPDGVIRWICDRAFPIRDSSEIVYRIVGFAEDITDQKRIQESLRASEERLELVITGSSDGFWDGQVLPDEPWTSLRTPVWWSPRVKAMLGYTDEEFPDVLESWASRLHPEDRDRVFAALTAHIDRRDPYDVEYRLITKAGEYRWFRARGQALWDDAGRAIRMSGSLQCVTDRRRAEDALRRSEQLLRDVADNTTAVIYVKYADGRYLLTNRRFEQIFNLTADQIVGHTDHEIFPRETADAFRAHDVVVLEQNRTVEYEEEAPHPDGPHIYISIKFPLCDHTGTPYATCGISTDITERKRIEHTLRTHEEQLRLALTSAEVGTWNWDLQTGRFLWSSQVDRFLGLSDGARPRTQKDWLALVYREDRKSMARTMRQAMDQPGTDVAFEHRVMRPDGSFQWCVWTGEIIRDHNGKALHILGTVRATTALGKDVPERRHRNT